MNEVFTIVKDNKAESVGLTPYMVHWSFINKKLDQSKFMICNAIHKLSYQISYKKWCEKYPLN